MQILINEDYLMLSRNAASLVANQINAKPNSVLGLATGSTPEGLYQELVALHQQGLDLSSVCTFNLDEYQGLPANHPASYRYYMEAKLFSKTNIPAKQTHLPNGMASNYYDECNRYEEAIVAAGGIDLQIVGVGHNGHIGFNEPGTPFEQKTHVVPLTDSTRQANSRYFASVDQVPTHALSMGIKTIMKARSILLLAQGKDKADIVAQALYGPVTRQVPASILQLHPNLTVVVDKSVGLHLKNKMAV